MLASSHNYNIELARRCARMFVSNEVVALHLSKALTQLHSRPYVLHDHQLYRLFGVAQDGEQSSSLSIAFDRTTLTCHVSCQNMPLCVAPYHDCVQGTWK